MERRNDNQKIKILLNASNCLLHFRFTSTRFISFINLLLCYISRQPFLLIYLKQLLTISINIFFRFLLLFQFSTKYRPICTHCNCIICIHKRNTSYFISSHTYFCSPCRPTVCCPDYCSRRAYSNSCICIYK